MLSLSTGGQTTNLSGGTMRSVKQFRMFDLHHHVGSLDMVAAAGAARAASDPKEDARIRLAFMDQHNIEQALLMPANGYPTPNGIADTRRVNDAMAAYRD